MDSNTSIKLFVGNLSYTVTSQQLSDLFSQYGEVEESVVITDRQTGRSRGFAFVTMKKEADGQKAIKELNGKDFEGRKLIVNQARPRQPRT